MGTNFYARTEPCPHCGRSDEEIHLGKSSMGWKFSLQFNGGKFYKNVPEMKKWLKGKYIFDEYGARVTHYAFWKMVEEKQKIIDPTSNHGEINIDGYKFVDHEFS